MSEQIENWLRGPGLPDIAVVRQRFTLPADGEGVIASMEFWSDLIRLHFLTVLPGDTLREWEGWSVSDDAGTQYRTGGAAQTRGGPRAWTFSYVLFTPAAPEGATMIRVLNDMLGIDITVPRHPSQ